MDKGLSLRQVDDLIETSGNLVDIVKLGFGFQLRDAQLEGEDEAVQDADMRVYGVRSSRRSSRMFEAAENC